MSHGRITKDLQPPRIGRRTLLILAGGTVLAACTDDKDGGTGNSDVPTDAKEAPALAKLVKDGTLPPLEERLPAEPIVVEPVSELGRYGGTWQTAITGVTDTAWLQRTMAYENLVRLVPDFTGAAGLDEIVPNVAESFAVDDTGREYTFQLRKGLKWSDGEPFTAEDIAFAYNDVIRNEALFPALPTDFASNGVAASLEVDDDYTVRFIFDSPNGLFLQNLARVGGWMLTGYPKHYAKQFHQKYNKNIDKLVSDEGQADWIALLFSKTGGGASPTFDNPDLPVLYPWKISVAAADGRVAEATRNPYYFKVDPEDRQLPYIDEVHYSVIEDSEVALLTALQGDIDMHLQIFCTPANKPTLAEGRKKGGFEFFDTFPDLMNDLLLFFNHTHADPVKRELFRNKDFRIGLSHAIDRQQVIDAVYQRQGEPFQAAPRPESPFYDEQMGKQYTEYDVDLANDHLDQAGYESRDGSGRRLGPDGKPISFTVEWSTVRTEYADAMELIKGYWQEVGVEINLNPIDDALYHERRVANKHDVNLWQGGGGIDTILNAFWWVPLGNRCDFGQLWATWYLSGGEAGEEPPEPTRRQLDLYDQLKATPDSAEQERLMREVLEIARDEFYTIGISLPGDGYGIVTNDFHNVPERMHNAYRYPTPAPTHPEQYYKS